jgi:hypothetical protein
MFGKLYQIMLRRTDKNLAQILNDHIQSHQSIKTQFNKKSWFGNHQ